MINFKISGAAAGAAFVLSFVIGLISGAGILVVIFRAFVFAALFFAFSCLVFWLLAQFLPEMLNPSEDEFGFPASGSRVDISLGDEGAAGAFPSDNSEMVDDIAGKPSTPSRTASLPLDQGEKSQYNDIEELGDDIGSLAGGNSAMDVGSYTAMPQGASPAGTLPDMDGLVDAVPGSVTDGVNTGVIGFDEPRRPKSSSRKSEMAGDFDPKELAQAIRTVLKKDDKG